MTSSTAWGFGLATVTAPDGPVPAELTPEHTPATWLSDDDTVLEVWYPEPALGAVPADATAPAGLRALEGDDPVRRVRTRVVLTEVDLDVAPRGAADTYLRLHLLSHRLVAPHGQNLDGIFAQLENVVWTDRGPCAVEGFEATRLRLRLATGVPVVVYGVDKFPRMVDYVLPSGVRIADADRVRLGAHLAPGTTVMHEGFVNFNAGTLGVSMVEGRISSGVVVGDGSDIGGGASIMGTLSGGGREVVSIGRRSLLGANAGLGIPLGDDCIVESGLYVTAGTKVTLVGFTDDDGQPIVGRTAKARDLAGSDGLLFRRNSLTGGVEAVARTGAGVVLNASLHQH